MDHRHFLPAIALLVCPFWLAQAAAEPTREELDFFETRIRPILVEHCFACHSSAADELRAGLRLDQSEQIRRGGDSGPALVAGAPAESLLFKAISYAEDVSPMPPDKPLPAEAQAAIHEWILRGAALPPDAAAADVDPSNGSSANPTPHWAFQQPQKSAPVVSRAADARRTLDRLIALRLHEQQLSPGSAAGPRVLARRLYLDLIGLPPSYSELESFAADPSPLAYEQLVDRLLASPRFAERWTRMWLDLARYSDTKGYVFTEDRNYPDAFKYRDWVIDAFNSDRPYRDFVRFQLAADQLAPDDSDELAAMGFLTLGRRFLNNQHDIIDDRIDVTTRGLMGLTVTCARCHDHKFDPIPMADYYSLYGVFASSHEPGGAPSPLRMVDKEQPTTPVVFLRGQPGRHGPEVPRQFLEVLSRQPRQPFQHGSGRLELAEAIAAIDNPLTARVFANRVWGRLFGSYLVDTPSDFGTRTPRPELADVLDDLAVEFVRHDGSLKWLVRELVTSTTYRQTSSSRPAGEQVDPANRWYWRMNRRRLDFEALRDAILSVSGQLQSAHIGGPSCDIEQLEGPQRRALYAHVDRQNFPGLFRTFDVAGPDTHSPKRFETTVPQQALYLLNSPFVLNQASAAARRTMAAAPTVPARIVETYRLILGRDPDVTEQQQAAEFIASQSPPAATNDDLAAESAWATLAQVLMMSNEFSFLD